MKICISNNFKDLKRELENRGYEVTNKFEADCDAMVCDLKNGGLSNMTNDKNIKNEGILVIDIGSKSIEEIDYILKNRVYSSLF